MVWNSPSSFELLRLLANLEERETHLVGRNDPDSLLDRALVGSCEFFCNSASSVGLSAAQS